MIGERIGMTSKTRVSDYFVEVVRESRFNRFLENDLTESSGISLVVVKGF